MAPAGADLASGEARLTGAEITPPESAEALAKADAAQRSRGRIAVPDGSAGR